MREVERRAATAYRDRFGAEPGVVASAPGRVNVIGEHTDYNGGYVLPCAIDRRVAVAAGEGPDGLYSDDFGEARPTGGCKDGTWADYPRGVAWALAESGHHVGQFQAAIAGDVPRGAGLSSSAAIEAATALALDALGGLNIPRRELAVLCRRAENGFVGVSSGIMDQYASLLCRAGAALLIDCRSLEARSVPLDLESNALALLVCDTRVERRLAATGYNDRRAACERAALTLGVPQLRDARPADVERLTGEERKRARHVVSENGRVLEAVEALEQGDMGAVGRLMFNSHASLRDDYEVSTPELDACVEAAREARALGARLTGAGFGGCAIALVAEDRVAAVERSVRQQLRDADFREPAFYRFHPSEGAALAA
jgi:galactokinase